MIPSRSRLRHVVSALSLVSLLSLLSVTWYATADDAVIPPPHDGALPSCTLRNGVTVPLVGLGCASGVREAHATSALALGYRYVDTARSYAWGYHEDEIGRAVHALPQQVFLQTKVHPEDLGYAATQRAVRDSFRRLNVEYLDAVLLHKPRCWEGACRTQPEGTWQESWRALEEFVDDGVVGAIGVCDVDRQLWDELSRQRILPHIVQNWYDPLSQDRAGVRHDIQRAGVLFQGYSSLGSQWVHHHQLKRNPVLHHPMLVGLAAKYHVEVPQIVVHWATRHGVSVLPASTNPDHQRANLVDSFAFDLTELEMRSIDALDGQTPDKEEPPPPDEVSVSFENQGEQTIDSFWVDTMSVSGSSSNEMPVGSILPGGELSLTSYHGHGFVFRNREGASVGKHVVTRDGGRTQRHVVHTGAEL